MSGPAGCFSVLHGMASKRPLRLALARRLLLALGSRTGVLKPAASWKEMRLAMRLSHGPKQESQIGSEACVGVHGVRKTLPSHVLERVLVPLQNEAGQNKCKTPEAGGPRAKEAKVGCSMPLARAWPCPDWSSSPLSARLPEARAVRQRAAG